MREWWKYKLRDFTEPVKDTNNPARHKTNVLQDRQDKNVTKKS